MAQLVGAGQGTPGVGVARKVVAKTRLIKDEPIVVAFPQPATNARVLRINPTEFIYRYAIENLYLDNEKNLKKASEKLLKFFIKPSLVVQFIETHTSLRKDPSKSIEIRINDINWESRNDDFIYDNHKLIDFRIPLINGAILRITKYKSEKASFDIGFSNIPEGKREEYIALANQIAYLLVDDSFNQLPLEVVAHPEISIVRIKENFKTYFRINPFVIANSFIRILITVFTDFKLDKIVVKKDTLPYEILVKKYFSGNDFFVLNSKFGVKIYFSSKGRTYFLRIYKIGGFAVQVEFSGNEVERKFIETAINESLRNGTSESLLKPAGPNPSAAMQSTGGIDFTHNQITTLKTNKTSDVFHLDPAMIARFRQLRGLRIKNLNIEPLKNISQFLDS